MSLENHPNFHAVNFALEVMKAYRNSLRGLGIKIGFSDKVGDMIAEFTGKIEEEVDEECK